MVLKNELGIDNSEKLAIEEERYGKIGALELFLEKETSQAGTFETLAYIHRKLFSKVYAHAGKMREINIAKGNFRFAPILFLNASIEAIESMPQSSFDEILEKYVEMNIAHPFREGNGRACRIWVGSGSIICLRKNWDL
ncbi:Fic/DOC family protein [Dubosiella newyorkensis]|uniref:Fic/DOC family protein n=1 Tax=Dubosiella newyorkensis TaxID=1862672 RepID=UPI003D9C796B